MKKIINTFCVAVALFVLVNRVTADDDKLPLVGEWTNPAKAAKITQIKFFPNGLVTVTSKGHGWSARYKVTASSAPRSDIYLVSGYIKTGKMVHFADADKQSRKANIVEDDKTEFTAKLTNHQKVMSLQVNSKGIKNDLILVKTNDIQTGNIPAN
jgi:hypothetical protein